TGATPPGARTRLRHQTETSPLLRSPPTHDVLPGNHSGTAQVGANGVNSMGDGVERWYHQGTHHGESGTTWNSSRGALPMQSPRGFVLALCLISLSLWAVLWRVPVAARAADTPAHATGEHKTAVAAATPEARPEAGESAASVPAAEEPI